MEHVRGRVTRWVDHEFPGGEVEIVEADGNHVALVAKLSVIDDEGRLTPGAALSVDVRLPCDVLRRLPEPGCRRGRDSSRAG